MMHQNDSKPPQHVAEAESLVGVDSTELLGAWGITDGEGYLTHGGSRERAEDIMWSMKNETESWDGKNLFLVWCEWGDFDGPRPWFPPNA